MNNFVHDLVVSGLRQALVRLGCQRSFAGQQLGMITNIRATICEQQQIKPGSRM